MVNNEIDEFNKRLKDNYGSDVALSIPRYKIVWSTDEYEIRKGTYHDYTDGDIYLRTKTEVRRTEKYPLFPNKWVLEALQPNIMNPELPDAKFSYEPLHIFGAARSHPKPVWDKVALLVEAHMFVMRVVSSPSDAREKEEQRFLKEKMKHKDIIKDAGNAFSGAMKAGEAVTVLTNNNAPLDSSKIITLRD